MPKEYSIELGVGLNKAQLNTVKEVLKSIESQKREVIYDVDFNIKNVDKLTRVGKEIDEIKAKLKELDNVGSIGKGKSPIAIDSKSLENSLDKIHDSIRKLQNAFGKVDSNKGVQSLLTTVNKIRKSLEDVSAQFEGLNKNLSALSSKDFSLNFDFGFGKSGAKNPEQAMQELKMLRKEIEEYQKYFSKFYSLDGKNTDPINRLMLQHNQRNQLYMMQLQQSMNKGSDAQRIAAAKEYIKTIKETAKAANIALEPVEFKLAESSEFIRVRNEASETENQLKEMFSGGIDAAKLHQDLTNITEDLRKIQEFVSDVSKNANIEGLTQSFNKLSETLEKLAANIVLTKNSLDTISAGTSGNLTSSATSAASDIVSATDKIEKESAASAAAVVQNEKKKQEAYKATTDTVMYHAGIVSKLNKAETNGRFYGSNRGTGYFGTGHYFVDSATKHELDNSSYSKLPYTSIDISQYDNLFKVTSDEVGYALHSFLANLTRFTQGSDDFNVDELFLQFKNVFGDTVMDIKEFGSKLEQLKSFMSNSNFYDRSDSVSTQFMKSLGYGGVDTRGTSYADTRYGTVIYDLKEESILQANITDELQKQGQMLEKIDYERGQVFDKDTDDKILRQLEEQIKRDEINKEFEKIYGSDNTGEAYEKLTNAKNRLQEIDGLISDYKREIDYVEDRTARFEKEMQDFGLELSDEEIEDFQKKHIENFENSIKELQQEKIRIESEIPSLEEADEKEAQLVREAMERAKQIVEQRYLEAQQSKESANAVVQGEERKQQALEQTANTYESVAQRARQAGKLISDSAQEAIDGVSSQSIDKAFTVDKEDSDAFRKEMENLVSQWTDSKGKLSKIKIDTETFYDGDTGRNIERISSAIVTYNNGLGETIKKTIALRQIGTDVNVVDGNEMSSPVYGFVEVASQYSKSLGKTKTQTDAFVKQQKQAVANLTNQINQLNRAANDQNAARPIKDSSHLDVLSSKYNEVISAIQRLKNASSDTFVDEQNNVKLLISDFKSLVSEYKNAENVSNKMKGTDFASGLEIAKNDLEKFKADAKDFPQIAKTISSLNDEIGKVGDASSLNKFNDQLRVARSELARIKSETNAANRSEKVGINVSGLESKIADLQRISPEINKFETEIDGAKVSVQSLLNDLRKIDTQSDFSVVNSKFRAFTDAAKAAGIAVTDTAAKAEAALAKDIRLDIELGNFDNDISLMHDKFNKLSGASDELCESVRKTEAAYQNLVNAANPIDGVVDNERLIQAQKEYAAYLEKTNNLIKIQAREEKAAAEAQKLLQDKESLKLDTLNWLNENTKAAKEYGAELKRLISLLDKIDDPVDFKEVSRDIKNIQKTAQVMGKTGLTPFDKLKEKAKEYMTYLSAAELFMYAEQALRSMFEQVKLIDSAMTELKKVTDETDASYNQFLTNAASRAKEIGTTIDGLVSSTADFARLGYEFADAQGLAEVANIYAVVGDDIDSVETATQSLISTLTAFKDEAGNLSESDFALSIVDKMNEVANNFAISSGGIGDALQRSASSMMAANNSLDETIALITAANTVVQDPDSVGTAFKTISMRIRGAKTELEEAGLETEGMAESTASLRKEIMALSGVDIMLNDNEFKSTYQIMDELADKWQDLTDIQQASVTELIAGKRQGNIVSSLMNNFDIAEQALKTSLNSAGSAMKEHEKWQQSLEAKILSLKASWQGLSQAFLSSDFLKVALDGVISLADGFTKLIDTFGTLPTLTGTFAAGFSLFKNGGIFKTFNTDLDTFTSKIGIANKSFAELANAFNSGKTGTGFKGFISGLKSVGDSLTNTLSKADLSAIESYNKLLDAGVDGQTAFAQSMKGTSSAAQNLVIGANGSKVAISGMTAATNASKIALIGAKVAAIAFNAALTMGISALITFAVQGISKLINAKKELAENVEEVTSKFKEQHEALIKNKSPFESQAKRYVELSKGIDEAGRNISLTADEYLEYQGIANSIADQIPTLVKGYDEEGNAILTVKDSVKELTDAYNELIIAKNNEVLTKGEDGVGGEEIFEDFQNKMAKTNKTGFWDSIWDNNKELTSVGAEALKSILSSDDLDAAIDEYAKAGSTAMVEIANAFRAEGYKQGGSDTWWNPFDDESGHDYIKRVIQENKKSIEAVKNNFQKELEGNTSGVKTAAKAFFSNAFLTDYSDIDSVGQDIINRMLPNLDSDFYGQFDSWEAVVTRFKTMLDGIKNLSDGDKNRIETSLELKTKFNNGEIGYGDYISRIKEASDFIDDTNLDAEIKSQLKLDLNVEEVISNYDALKNRLMSDVQLESEEAEAFLNDLTASKYAVYVDLVMNNESILSGFKNIDELNKYLEKQAKISEALNFTIAVDVETESIEAFNTAMAESVSAAGLSSESIGALKSRYADLESQGYDLSSMFEETSNGIHLNRAAVDELEEAYASQKLADVDKNLKTLKDRYDELTAEINNASSASERASLYREQQTIVQKINDLSTLASQYKGLTSAYNEWLAAEEAGQERDMYEQIIEGFETVGDEISRGWMDDGSIKFLELLTGQTNLASKSGAELLEIYNGLSNKIGNSKYSIRDFFTVDDDGNSTNAGVYNFLETVETFEDKLGDVIKRDGDGNIIGFDFEVAGGDEAVAEALGISEELVQIMVRAADDAGFVVTLDGAYAQLADLKTEAERRKTR